MDVVYAVSKNSWAIAKFGPNVYAPENMVIGDSLRGSEVSQANKIMSQNRCLQECTANVNLRIPLIEIRLHRPLSRRWYSVRGSRVRPSEQ